MVQPDLEFCKFLGKGSYGSVSLYKNREPGMPFYTAVKTSKQKHAESLHNEFEILSKFKGCSRIVQVYENRVRENLDGDGNVEHMMLMEYASGGSLRTFMKLCRDNILPEPFIRSFTRMLLQGLATIHAQGYVHCDLKPGNILVFPRFVNKNGTFQKTYEVKISDFGLTKRDGDSSWWSPSHTCVGTPIYMPPESISHGETGGDLDLWSLGCVVLEMYTGKKPWWHTDYDLSQLKDYYEPLIPSDLPCDAQQFIMTCFESDSDEPRDALTLLNHHFFRGDHMNKINEPPVDPRELALKMEKIVQTLAEIKIMSQPAGDLKIIKEQPRPNLVHV